MKLRRPCDHGRYDPHTFITNRALKNLCSGGEFLADGFINLDALTKALTASEGVIYQEDGWAELNEHGILVFDAAVAYLTLFRGADALIDRKEV